LDLGHTTPGKPQRVVRNILGWRCRDVTFSMLVSHLLVSEVLLWSTWCYLRLSLGVASIVQRGFSLAKLLHRPLPILLCYLASGGRARESLHSQPAVKDVRHVTPRPPHPFLAHPPFRGRLISSIDEMIRISSISKIQFMLVPVRDDVPTATAYHRRQVLVFGCAFRTVLVIVVDAPIHSVLVQIVIEFACHGSKLLALGQEANFPGASILEGVPSRKSS